MAIDAPSRTRGFYTRAMDVSNQIQRFATAAFDPSPKVMFLTPKLILKMESQTTICVLALIASFRPLTIC